MPQVKPDVEAFARIKVLGVGGSGGNAVEHMINSKVTGVDFIAINTDSQDLHHSSAKKKIHIGKNVTRGLGTGMNPELGQKAVEDTREEVQESLKGADMAFIACGMGGGTGTGAAPRIAQMAKETGALTVAVVTKPFFFEGKQRMQLAERGLEELRKAVDAIILIPNDRLLATIDKNTTAKDAFSMSDEILKQAVEGISDLITTPGIINIDFADIKSVMENAGAALMGVGYAGGDKRAEKAAKNAINSPLLELSINGARGVLFSIAGGEDVTMFEIQDAAKTITESVDPDAKIIFGTVHSDKLKKNELKVTVIASGFSEQEVRNTLFDAENQRITPSGEQKERKNTREATTPTPHASEKAPSGQKPGRIYNSVPHQKTKEAEEKKAEDKDDDDDDWGAVPAFLRRSRFK